MSFDVFLQRFENGDASDTAREPVLAVLHNSRYTGPDEFGFYIVSFPDDTEVEFSASELESDEPFGGCAFHLRGLSEDVTKFMLEIARAGDMVMMAAMEGNPLIFIHEAQKQNVPPGLLSDMNPLLVGTPAELLDVLTGGFDSWAAYRDRVLGSPTKCDP